ncbi:MAG: threonine--tRNA ligase [Deltaproteobacteria bacterium]|nr:threonine--tRNA ligase [Deltaproteobacteria bacterium]MBW2052411.1 threonine--tRNA ligase [Deltaproteobacteria bacterium]MBW2140134.1 threonine--tRNA ligase [Deltaproteobacteria bacterium]MBW2322240.1 threonine--tRNA ligase [Deltaproteobacteria bacterium]
MEEVQIKINDAEEIAVSKGTTAEEIFASNKVGQDAVAARFNGQLIDLTAPLNTGGELKPLRRTEPEALEMLRHSTSHIMAQAVRQLFPGVKVTIGPSIENGFYYDFDYDSTFTPEDLPRIEARMAEIIAQEQPFSRREMSRAEAIKLFENLGEPYKVEILQDMDDEEVSIYELGDFIDLCRGPHLVSSKKVPAFKLLGVSGAYWRGDERRQRLQRIYGTAFFARKELKQHLNFLEEAKKRDHRRLGKDLDLFSIHEEAGAGLVIWHPRGALLRALIEDFERTEHLKRGYDIVSGPMILKTDLWQASGHFDNYRENMYFTEVDKISYGIKPMNCLSHMLIYKSRLRSYRDLPLRYFELGTVFRHEKSGVLHGLIRVRQFTQDDAHIICTPDQLNDEIKGVIQFVVDIMGVFGFEFETEISTRPEKSIGTDEDWELATTALQTAMEDMGLKYDINVGDGAFYGPKIDVNLKDALNRRWQCATIQCDLTLPERFDLTFVGSDGERHRPVMIHRTILGSIERFIGVLIEHYAGAFPVWLAPVQAVILTVTDRGDEYAREVYAKLKNEGLRVELDLRNEKLGLKIREAQLMKVPYMLVIGDREVEQGGISPRTRTGKDLKFMTVEEFKARVQPEIQPPVFQ